MTGTRDDGDRRDVTLVFPLPGGVTQTLVLEGLQILEGNRGSCRLTSVGTSRPQTLKGERLRQPAGH